ncbi:MAG: hypothetical protein JWM33_2396 [Caulobacteraceae bacterium]|nr:hypothetical protein [Caulobacteraceae bacterium]
MTYVQLLAAICGWLRKPEVEQQISTFIALAEAQIGRRLAEAGVTGATVRADAAIGGEYLAVPGDLAMPLALTVAGGHVVENITLDSLDALKARAPTQVGRPLKYAVVGRDLRFFPPPNTSYVGELVYQQQLAPLSAGQPTNWLLASHPDVYLYGALVQAGPYLDEEPRLAAWSNLYASGLDDLIKAERARAGSRHTPGFRAHLPAHSRTFNIQTGY